MEYEIVKSPKHFFIRTQVDITSEEYDKLEKINHKVTGHIRKDLQFESITVTSTNVTFVKEFGEQRTITSMDIREFTKNVKEFFTWLKEYQVEEPECPTHENSENDGDDVKVMEDLEFVKKMLEDINKPNNNPSHILGAIVVDTTTSVFCPELTGWGKMSHDLLKDMCELYIKTYDKG